VAENHGFFAIDRRRWAEVSAVGVTGAVAYLVLSRGSGRDNRTTSWSIDAIERYTGISRGRAHKGVQQLVKGGLVSALRGGTKPQYELLPWSRPAPDDLHKWVVDKVQRGKKIPVGDRDRADSAVKLGWLAHDDDGQYRLAPEPAPDRIWLPNELVTGAAGETPPVELVRQTQDPMTLRLFVDFYYAQHLREDGGIGRNITYQKYERVEIGRRAQFIIWGFRRQGSWVAWNDLTRCHRREALTKEEKADGKNEGIDFFRRQEQLVDLGLIEWVPHLFESDSADAEMLHPVGMTAAGEIEDRLGRAAHTAGESMLTDAQRDRAKDGGLWLVPVPRHIANVQMVGISRLRYRPQTRMTAAWWADLAEKGERFVASYEELASKEASREHRLRSGGAP
jgi:hypothetical protein